MKRLVSDNRHLHGIVRLVYETIGRTKSFDSKNYWERRYERGGRSGAGSYGRLAQYKADFLNSFVREQNISSVIEFGSGDGAQLGLFQFKEYIGLDVSKTSIKRCMGQYAKDGNKSFFLYDAEFAKDNHHLFTAELALSLDVIYHLVEDGVFEAYMSALFAAAGRFVIIYASNTNENNERPQHVRHRKFTDWVEKHEEGWTLIDHAINKYGLKMDGSAANEMDRSFADFYVYSKTKL
jgi:hypothetical protein